ncbi:MAG: PEP/pyruvate-binding domain-containing protein, partial [Bacillota bacterium]|nr:PEP/pyruvate-binding domain-containing protein [Bacillota bacterium]
GYKGVNMPYIFSFEKLLKKTDFPALMKDMLKLLSKVYDYPVDIEFTANFAANGSFKINLLQCRPLQTRGLGKPVKMPEYINTSNCLFYSKSNFMGGNIHLPIDYTVYIGEQAYLELSEQEKYSIARTVGVLNQKLKGKNAMLIGPGRWGTTTPSLGVPVHFSELCNMSVICEVASSGAGFTPELSYGSHFFQDLVETGIFYAAIFDGQKDVIFNPDPILRKENLLAELVPHSVRLSGIIHVADTKGMEIFSDIVTQTLMCKR